EAFAAIKAMDAFDIIVIAITVVVYLAVYGFPFMAATPGLPYRQSFQLNQGAFAISNGVPAGGAFGLGIQYAMLASYQVEPTVATAAIGATGVWSIFVTLGLPVFGLIAIAASGTIDAGSYVYIGAIGLAALLAMVIVFALVMRSEKLAIRIGGWANAVAAPAMRVLKKDAPDLVPTVVKFRTDIVGLVTRRWHVITVSQVAVSLCQFAILYASLRGVEGSGPTTPLLVAFGAWAVAQIGIMIPITPGGLGTVDAFMISLMTAMGVPSGDATAADLVWRASSFVPQIIVGVLCLVTWSRRAARTFAAASPAPTEA
ncbi:MAG TPA: lysylphosphatidylglycerol synthase transmembrane domain-containing protein, partial [Candidatus Nanopelagicales bacterium]|nr:lysylphosphatidylglycerol synthase transmembrane domain-containing protein [Candidatus Nanopelagicales bacterium]